MGMARSDRIAVNAAGIQGNDKKRARLNCIDHLLKQVPYEEVSSDAIELPNCVFNPRYERRTLPRELHVPEVY